MFTLLYWLVKALNIAVLAIAGMIVIIVLGAVIYGLCWSVKKIWRRFRPKKKEDLLGSIR